MDGWPEPEADAEKLSVWGSPSTATTGPPDSPETARKHRLDAAEKRKESESQRGRVSIPSTSTAIALPAKKKEVCVEIRNRVREDVGISICRCGCSCMRMCAAGTDEFHRYYDMLLAV